MNNELSGKVLKWLGATGFPLEMAAASAFRSAGFDIAQSSAYLDPQTEKGREIDILATDPDLLGAITVNFVLECKATNKPWVVLTSSEAFANYNRLRAFGIMNEHASRALASRLPVKFGSLAQYIERPAHGGYGLRQAFCEDRDAAYAAAVNVLKAAQSIVRSSERSSVKSLAFVFPVIVVDAPIFECSLSDEDELDLKEVEESAFLFSTFLPDSVGCSIRVVRRTHLPGLAIALKQIANSIRTELKSEEDSIVAAWSESSAG